MITGITKYGTVTVTADKVIASGFVVVHDGPGGDPVNLTMEAAKWALGRILEACMQGARVEGLYVLSPEEYKEYREAKEEVNRAD